MSPWPAGSGAIEETIVADIVQVDTARTALATLDASGGSVTATPGTAVLSLGAGIPGGPEMLGKQWGIYEETAAKHERPLIAGVFLNRLRFASFTPKLLQTDPTIVYGCMVPADKSEACKKFEGRIRTIQLRDKDNHVIDSLRYACEGARRARPANTIDFTSSAAQGRPI